MGYERENKIKNFEIFCPPQKFDLNQKDGKQMLEHPNLVDFLLFWNVTNGLKILIILVLQICIEN